MIFFKLVKLTKSPKLYKGDKYCRKEFFLKKTTESRYKTRETKHGGKPIPQEMGITIIAEGLG